jgi:hypothetical protein
LSTRQYYDLMIIELHAPLDGYHALFRPIYPVAATFVIEAQPTSNLRSRVNFRVSGFVYPNFRAEFVEVSQVWLYAMDHLVGCFIFRFCGNPLACSIARTFSSKVRFSRSAIPLCSGVSCTVKFRIVPAALRWFVNSCPRNSPPRSALYTSKVSSLCRIRYRSPQVRMYFVANRFRSGLFPLLPDRFSG